MINENIVRKKTMVKILCMYQSLPFDAAARPALSFKKGIALAATFN
ncbi:MAG: hypothetical protein KJP06_07320 [Deltaproteobacteria bacterium]|nr:hypothetical protein [Deltaproteobacteria bacterium]